MVVLILATGAAIYFGIEKVRNHQKKKRAAKTQQLDSQRDGSIEPGYFMDNKGVRRSMETLPPYQKDALPPYYRGNLQLTT